MATEIDARAIFTGYGRMTIFVVLVLWVVVSIPVGLMVGWFMSINRDSKW